VTPSDVQSFSHTNRGPVRWVLGLIAGMLVAVLLVIGVMWLFAGVGLVELGRMLRGGQLHISVDQPTVIRQIRSLQRLETVSYTMDKIVTGERNNPILPQPLAGDRLLLMVHGEVVAGLDLSKLQPADVNVHGKTVSIQLPKAELFATTLDNEKTKVYSRDTGLFSSPDPNLESQVRAEAERQLQAAALQDGILKTAEQNGRQTLTSLLTGLGFASVEIR
jgi:hypothetical protein